MELLVIRHAIAENPETVDATGQDDAHRPLTKRGRRRMREIARGLRTVVPAVDVIATSPFSRAAQTADILSAAYDAGAPILLDALTPTGSREALLEWIRGRAEDDVVALVGHEPYLGLLVSWLLAAPLNHFIELRKGGACLLTWSEQPGCGTAWLRWALPPSLLRRLAKRRKKR